MSKHTKGPWEVCEHDHGTVIRTESAKKTKYGASRYAVIGGFESSDPEQMEEARANARLIAAAPDLLAALRTLVDEPQPLGIDRAAYRDALLAIERAGGWE